MVVAFLANGNPLWSIFASFFLGGLRSGANIMQRAVGVPSTLVEAIQGLIVVFVAMSLAFNYEKSYWAKLIARRRALESTERS